MRHIRFWVCFLLLLTSGITVVGQQSTANVANATVPQLVKFSGVLTDDSGKPLTGTVGVTFLLYKDEQGGSPLWLETQNVQPSKNGYYTVMLGTTTSQGLPPDIFVSGEARWLAVQAQGQQEYPRVLLVSVPYALKAVDAQTVGGLPPSAFVLAAPGGVGDGSTAANSTASSASSAPSTSSNVTTTGGTVNALPLWTTTTNIQSSAITQSGTGATAKVGINTTKPAATLDVAGGADVRGLLSLPATGTATSTGGKNSQPLSQAASVFNSGTKTAVPQTFQWQAEPVGNNTSGATGSLNLLFGQGTSKPAETGLNIASNGQITFAKGQTFPGTGTGNGTITGVTAGTDLTGGGTSGSVTLNVDTTKVPQLVANNNFTGNQTVNGNLSATGVVTGNSFQIGSNLFAFGTLDRGNAFLGFAGNVTTTGLENAASGAGALNANASGSYNTATGVRALQYNTGDSSGNGSYNTATGWETLASDTTGSFNTANGAGAGYTEDFSLVTGSYNTFLGTNIAMSTGTLSNATAVGANAEVTASNAMVLGSINGVNGAASSTNVGIGTTAPTYLLHIGNTGGANYNNFLRVEGPVNSGTGGFAASFGGYGDFGIDAVGYREGRFFVLEKGNVGIGCGLSNSSGCNLGNILAIGRGLGPAIADGWAQYSSRRWKTNIQTLENALGKVEHLRGVSYDQKQSGKHEVGVIAEEVGKVVPEIVSWEKNGKDASGVDYSRLTALLIEAVKEQQREIASQNAQISKLRDKGAQQARVLQKLAAQMTILQSRLAQVDGDGNASGMKPAKKASVKITSGHTEPESQRN